MANPKIDIELTAVDRSMKILAWVFTAFMFVYSGYYYENLPDQIPTHFDMEGNPDDYSSKVILWTLPIIGLLLVAGFSKLANYPHIYNYSTTITADNAQEQYHNSVQLLFRMMLIIVLGFAYLNYSSVQIALERKDSLSQLFTPLFLISLFGCIFYSLFISYRKVK